MRAAMERPMRGAIGAAVFVAAILLLVVGYRDTNRVADSGADGETCIADSIGTLQRFASIPACTRFDLQCRVDCLSGDAAKCVGLAYAADSPFYFHRACVLGSAIGCTNFAAGIWARKHSAGQLKCIRRTFEKSCAANEPFACGMVGRIMIEAGKPPAFAEGRKYLQAACDRVGGFPCRVLAKHLESGKLGAYPPGTIRTLLARACEGGDPDACGEPATAAETFR
jgi:hypothetical protein